MKRNFTGQLERATVPSGLRTLPRGRSGLTVALLCGAFLVHTAGLAADRLANAIVPLPASVAVDPAKRALGERLFFDPRLSLDGAYSCASCHPLNRAGMDARARAVARDRKTLLRNTPTVFNLAFDAFYNWDGATETLEAHDARVLLNPALMGMDAAQLKPRLAADAQYARLFANLYRDGISVANVLDALAQFERSLVTPDCRFDQFLRGNKAALTQQEIRGYHLFQSLGCIACHQGRNIGGNLMQKFGVFADTAKERRAGEPVDPGRFGVTGDEMDREVFRVPSLRNVAVTAPYFHDGRAPTLEIAVATMARVQLGRDVAAADIEAIVAFLGTLTGRYQGEELRGSP